MTETRKLRVFLCHSSQDKPIVRELYQRLNAEGWIDSWLDEEKLLPGQNWDMEIEKAVEAADAVIVCLSTNSVSKEGYLQRELKFVLDIAQEKPEGIIFIIPLRLDDCVVPRRLKGYQYQDYFPLEKINTAFIRLIKSLDSRAEDLHLNFAKSRNDSCSISSTGNGSMLDGPKLIGADGEIYFGTYHILRFAEKDQGKTLKISAKSQGEIFWIELWTGVYDGMDGRDWVSERVHIIRSPHRSNPEITWRIEVGDYTAYFVTDDLNNKVTDFHISYEIFVE